MNASASMTLPLDMKIKGMEIEDVVRFQFWFVQPYERTRNETVATVYEAINVMNEIMVPWHTIEGIIHTEVYKIRLNS